MRVKAPVAIGNWQEDARYYKRAIIYWLLVNALDYGLTVACLSLELDELSPLIAGLSTPVFALYKIFLTTAVIVGLALWGRLRLLKWLNIIFTGIVLVNGGALVFTQLVTAMRW